MKVAILAGGYGTRLIEETKKRPKARAQLMAYRHSGFWQYMDTIHDKIKLEKIWQSGKASWKI